LGTTSHNRNVEPSRRERREQRSWERRMQRELRKLDRGAARPGRRTFARRRTTGPVLPGLLISGVLAGLVMLHDPGMTGYRFRQLVDHLTSDDAGSYAFVATSADGEPVGWDHCEPIHYVVNPAGAPDEWKDIVTEGIGAVSNASGFDFQYDGTSVERSFEERVSDPDGPPPVLIAWANSNEVPDLAGSTAGIGGGTPMRVGGRVRYVSGIVVLDTDAYDRMDLRGDGRAEALILAHELGHVLGLDHVDDISELMNAEYVGQAGFGPGDREGLQQLHDLPC
jgi:hypothetical protein